MKVVNDSSEQREASDEERRENEQGRGVGDTCK